MTKGLLLIRMYEGRGVGGMVVVEGRGGNTLQQTVLRQFSSSPCLFYFFLPDVTLALTWGFIIDTDT